MRSIVRPYNCGKVGSGSDLVFWLPVLACPGLSCPDARSANPHADSDACLDRAKAHSHSQTPQQHSTAAPAKVRTTTTTTYENQNQNQNQIKQSEPEPNHPRIPINPQLGPREALSLAYTSPVLLYSRPSFISKIFGSRRSIAPFSSFPPQRQIDFSKRSTTVLETFTRRATL